MVMENNMNKVKRIISCFLVVALVFSVYLISYRTTRVEYAHLKYEQFFKDDTEYDVMFFGAGELSVATI